VPTLANPSPQQKYVACSSLSVLTIFLIRTGATRVQAVHHIVRRANWHDAAEAEKELPDSARVTVPANARYVHVGA